MNKDIYTAVVAEIESGLISIQDAKEIFRVQVNEYQEKYLVFSKDLENFSVTKGTKAEKEAEKTVKKIISDAEIWEIDGMRVIKSQAFLVKESLDDVIPMYREVSRVARFEKTKENVIAPLFYKKDGSMHPFNFRLDILASGIREVLKVNKKLADVMDYCDRDEEWFLNIFTIYPTTTL